MTREQKVDRARELRAAGWSYKAIADELGFANHGGVIKLLNPGRAKGYYDKDNRRDSPSGQRKREYEARKRAERERRPVREAG